MHWFAVQQYRELGRKVTMSVESGDITKSTGYGYP